MSEKKQDNHNRWRNKTVAFRMSPEEAQQLDTMVRLSGLQKQEYLICRALEQLVVVNGNPRVFKALRNQFEAVLAELRRLERIDDQQEELLSLLRYMAAIMEGLKEDSK